MKETKLKTFLIVDCNPLNDQYECDADRTPLCVIQEPEIPDRYKKYGYEVYEIFSDGSLYIRQDYYDYDWR